MPLVCTQSGVPKGMRRCRSCADILPLELFRNRSNSKGKGYECRTCSKEILKSQQKRSAFRRRLKDRGLTEHAYELILDSQGNKCAICEAESHEIRGYLAGFAIDHDHATGKVRGLLCTACNLGLGNFKDKKETLRRAIVYLEKNQQTTTSNEGNNLNLTREQILSADDRPVVAVEVPEWGGTVYVRTLSGIDRAKFEALCAGQPVETGQIMEKLVAFAACDESGNSLFTQDDVTELSKKNATVLLRVFSVASRLNALQESDIEKIKGN